MPAAGFDVCAILLWRGFTPQVQYFVRYNGGNQVFFGAVFGWIFFFFFLALFSCAANWKLYHHWHGW